MKNPMKNQKYRTTGHRWAILFEPFPDEGFEYVREGNPWTANSPIKIFNNRDDAEEEKRKWNTGIVTTWRDEDGDQ